MLESILDRVGDYSFVKVDGHDAAIVGLVETESGLHLLYSLSKVYNKLIDDDDFDMSDCHEWYHNNMLSLSSMESGPVFLEDLM